MSAEALRAERSISARARFGVIVPSTNTVVEHDYNAIGPRGCTFHAGRMYIADPAMDSNANFKKLIKQIRESIDLAIRDVLTCEPDYMIMGMSAETFWGGVKGNEAFEQRVRDATGLGVSTGATACRMALETMQVRRIAVFTPYQPIADEQVGQFFREAGFEVAALTGLRCPTATAIAEVGEAKLEEVVEDLDDATVEAVVQVGTNLSFVALAERLEAELHKPVLAINAATLWHALRAVGIHDRIQGFGSLLSLH